MPSTRRQWLSGAAALGLCACAPAEQRPESWRPPEGAFDAPGFALWDAPAPNARAPLDAPLLTSAGRVRLSELIGARAALLSFWAPWCAPCLAEKPSLDALAARLAEAGADIGIYSILAFADDEQRTIPTAEDYARRLNLSHLEPIVDASSRIVTAFRTYVGGISGEALAVGGANPSLPCSTLIGPDGVEFARLNASILYTPPPGLSPAEIAATNPADVISSWRRRELWRDDDMFEFLRAFAG